MVDNTSPSEPTTNAPPATPVAQSPVVAKVLGEREAKLDRLSKTLEKLSNPQLDAVNQYANTMVGK